MTEFERGIQRFGYLLTRIMLVMVVVVLAINIFMAKPPIASLLFALALAVGLTPELLPAIISITLSHGAKRMAKRGVIVRRLNSIENLGSMDVLCTDKTGTLTEGVVELDGAFDVAGQPSPAVLRLAAINAHFQTGLTNPLDEAVSAGAAKAGVDLSAVKKVDEIPYDFVRKCLSVVAADAQGERTLITKGALDNVLGMCTTVQAGDGAVPLDAAARAQIEARYDEWSAKGYRVLGVASRVVDDRSGSYARADERDLCFAGFLLFLDPPKADVRQTIVDLAQRGAAQDHHRRQPEGGAPRCRSRGPAGDRMMTGSELNAMSDEALWHAAERTTVFAEVDPEPEGAHHPRAAEDRARGRLHGRRHQRRAGPARRRRGHLGGHRGGRGQGRRRLRAAAEGPGHPARRHRRRPHDVRQHAQVHPHHHQRQLRQHVQHGRGLGVPALPAAARLRRSCSTISCPTFPPPPSPATTWIPEWVEKPRRWNTVFIRDYMVLFGLVSSIFDFLTFGVLLFLFRASPEEFRTGWFIESLLTELVIALVVRTRRPFFRSRPGNLLLASTAFFIAVTLVLPYLPYTSIFGFVPLPAPLMLAMIGLTVALRRRGEKLRPGGRRRKGGGVGRN